MGIGHNTSKIIIRTAWGEMPDIGDGEEGSTSHCHVCTYAIILHVLHMYPKTQNAIKNKKKKKLKITSVSGNISCVHGLKESIL